jgi:hypothetical protein
MAEKGVKGIDLFLRSMISTLIGANKNGTYFLFDFFVEI